jgi:DNA-binding NarL/FixJ family response regulator
MSAQLEERPHNVDVATATEVHVHRMRILLADDNAALRQTVRQIIEENPRWKICGEAADGRTAVELARRLNPDVVILDYKMPLMNGVEAAHLIGSFLPRAAMVLFTGEATKAVVQQARGSGIGAVLSKAGNGYLRLLSFIDRVSTETQVRHSASPGKRKSTKRDGPSDLGPGPTCLRISR